MGRSVGQEARRGTKRSHISPGVTNVEDPQSFPPEGRVFLTSVEKPGHWGFLCFVRLSHKALRRFFFQQVPLAYFIFPKTISTYPQATCWTSENNRYGGKKTSSVPQSTIHTRPRQQERGVVGHALNPSTQEGKGVSSRTARDTQGNPVQKTKTIRVFIDMEVEKEQYALPSHLLLHLYTPTILSIYCTLF